MPHIFMSTWGNTRRKQNVQLFLYITGHQSNTPFPFLSQTCWEGLEYVRQNSEDLHIDRERIAVGGDSAGGALAAACTLRSREEGKSDICFQMLIYPVLDARMKTESMKKYTDSPVWNAHLSKKMLDIRCSALRRAFNEVLQQSACRSEGLRDTADQ